MKWDTREIKNITEEEFIGKYDGVEIRVKPGESRFLPVHIAEHIAKQLSSLMERQMKDKEGVQPEDLQMNLESRILGPKLATANEDRILSTKEEIEKHEKEYAELKREEIVKKETLMQEAITENHDAFL